MQQKYHRNNSRFEKHMLMHVFRARECIDILTQILPCPPPFHQQQPLRIQDQVVQA